MILINFPVQQVMRKSVDASSIHHLGDEMRIVNQHFVVEQSVKVPIQLNGIDWIIRWKRSSNAFDGKEIQVNLTHINKHWNIDYHFPSK